VGNKFQLLLGRGYEGFLFYSCPGTNNLGKNKMNYKNKHRGMGGCKKPIPDKEILGEK